MTSQTASINQYGKAPRILVRSTGLIAKPRLVMLTLLIAAVASLFAYLMPHFLTADNLVTLARQTSVIAIVAMGATFVIIAGEIDLSVGAVVALAAVLAAWTSRHGLPVSVMLLAALAAGGMVGVVNGFLTFSLKVPSFLATLGTLSIVKGLAMTITLEPLSIRSLPFISFFRVSLVGIPMPVIIALVLSVVAVLLLNYTRFGIRTRAGGSNESNARLAGLNAKRHKYHVLILGSTFAAIGGVVLAGRTNFGMSQSAIGLELDVIAAVVLGGARLGGGVGSIVGTLLSAILLTMIFTGISTLGLPGSYQDIAKGLAIGIAVLLMKR